MTFLVVIIFLILYMFFWEREKPRFKELSFFEKYKRLILFSAVGLLPVAVVYLVVPNTIPMSGKEMIHEGEQDHNLYLVYKGFERIAAENPDDLDAQFNFIDAKLTVTGNHDWECKTLKTHYDSFNLQEPIFLYLTLTCEERLPSATELPSDSTMAGYYYLMGKYHALNGNKDLAIQSYESEINSGTLVRRSYESLLYLAYQDKKQLDKLLSRWESIRYLDYHLLKEYYFHNSKPIHYLYNLYYHSYSQSSWFIVLVALFVSAIWLIYIRAIDVFDKEKWVHIIFVFLLSALMTDLCLFFYDLFHHYTDLALYKSSMDDFIYCVVVIGGSEELIKLIPWVLFAWLSKKANEPYDFILYASVSALGFAFAENLMYYDRYDLQVIVVRALMSCVGHMFFASLVAYGYILYKYRFKTQSWRWTLPIAGFIAACVAHGFYDFWLISPAVSQFSILTSLFFLLSLHIWHTFKNNALNNSVFYNQNVVVKNNAITYFLLISFMIILMIEFVTMSSKYGYEFGFSSLKSRSFFVAFFGLYMVSTFGKYKLQKGVWRRIQIPALKRFRDRFKPVEKHDHTGLELRIFAPKTNVYIGDQMPVTGICKQRITVSGDDNWYVFFLNQHVRFQHYVQDIVLIRHKNSGQNLTEDKIPIYFMMLENAYILDKNNIRVEDLRYMGRAYSRPITL